MGMKSVDDSAHGGSEKRPRLFIKKVAMRNFKSYAGPVNKGFSTVVGPNGSGKSNVIDAMLFVSGKSAKQHDANRTTIEDAQKQVDNILRKIDSKTTTIEKMQSDLEKNKHEALEARKVEAECIKEQEARIPLGQAARKAKSSELKSVLESRIDFKRILNAKEFNRIEELYCQIAKYDIAMSTASPDLIILW